MPLGELTEGIFRIVGRLIVEIFVDVFLEVICYFVGKVVLRVLTFGNYPPAIDQDHREWFVQMVGLIALALMFFAMTEVIS